MESKLIEIGSEARRCSVRVYEGGSGPDLLFVHGAGGLLADDPFLARLAEHYRVHAPLLPGYEDSEGSDHLRDMLDFTLTIFDVWDALDLEILKYERVGEDFLIQGVVRKARRQRLA